MGFTEKTNYLLETKSKFKDRINSLGGSITSGTTFRDYLVWLDSLYEALDEMTITGLPDSLEGKCEQEGTPTPSSPIPINITTGRQDVVVCEKNLFNKDTTNYVKGYYLNNNGEEQISGNWGVYYIPVKPNTAYSISGCQLNGGVSFCWFDINKTFISRIGQKQNRENMVSPNNASYIGLSIVWNTSSSAYDGNTFMLEEGTTATTYEEYKGNDYEINLGKNLCETGTSFYGGSGQWYNQFGENMGTVSAIQSNTHYINLQSNTSYKFYIHEYNNISNVQIIYLDSTNTLKTYANYSISTNVATFTTTTYTKVWIRVKATASADNTYFIGQLEKGDATSYSPYKTPIYLGKIGTYQDYIFRNTTENPLYDSTLEEGQWYIHKEIGRVVLDSTNHYSGGTTGTNAYYLATNISDGATDNSKELSMSNMFKPCSFNARGNGLDITYVQNGRLTLRTANNTSIDWSTGTARQNWLNANKPICYYVLNTPTNTLIEDEELINQLNEIDIFTVISEDFYN